LNKNSVSILGIPSDENSSFMRGAALAPAAIRKAFLSDSSNLCTENNINLGKLPQLSDLGDIEFSSEMNTLKKIEISILDLLNQQRKVLSLGGDHSITYPIIKAYASKYPRLNIVHLDAHPDLYDEFDGNRYSHACPFARIKEENLCDRLVQLGIRTMNPHQREQAKRFNVEVIEMRNWRPQLEINLDGPIYLSVDLDALDPAFAPGVSHPEAGGFSTREAVGIIQNLNPPVVGADIVEFNPSKDPSGITAVAAAKIMKEILACLIS